MLYYDIEVLLFFWVTSDILNNMTLWTNLSYWIEQGQEYTYWLYSGYLFVSLGMIIFLFNRKWLSRFVFIYLSLTLFSTIRYLLDIFSEGSDPFTWVDTKNITITIWYATMWMFILFKLQNERLKKELNNE